MSVCLRKKEEKKHSKHFHNLENIYTTNLSHSPATHPQINLNVLFYYPTHRAHRYNPRHHITSIYPCLYQLKLLHALMSVFFCLESWSQINVCCHCSFLERPRSAIFKVFPEPPQNCKWSTLLFIVTGVPSGRAKQSCPPLNAINFYRVYTRY